MPSSWVVEEEEQRLEGLGLHSSDCQRENSLCDWKVGQQPFCSEEWKVQGELREVEGKSWWLKEGKVYEHC